MFIWRFYHQQFNCAYNNLLNKWISQFKKHLTKKSRNARKSTSRIWNDPFNTKWSTCSSRIIKSMVISKHSHSMPKTDSSKFNSTITIRPENSTKKQTSRTKSLSDPSISILIFNYLMLKWKSFSSKESPNRTKDKSSILPEDSVFAKYTQTTLVSEEEN